MHWREHFERLSKHKAKHDQGVSIQKNWRLGGCEICFPQSIGLGIEAGQFWDFIQAEIPEAQYFTSKGQELVRELVFAVRDIPAKPEGSDLTKLYNKSKAIILCIQYSKAPSVGLEQLARGIRKVVLETKDF